MSKSVLKITTAVDGGKATVKLDGQLNTMTAGELDEELKKLDCTELMFDLAGLEYITSSGIRVMIGERAAMKAKGGKMYAVGLNDDVTEILQTVGLYDLFTQAD